MYKYKAKAGKIIDGDTIDVVVDVGFKITVSQRIRLAGINTPETFRRKKNSEEYKRGIAAKNYLKKRLAENKNEITLETAKDPDLYGRYLGTIIVKDSNISLNDELLKKGHATVYKK
ncbi:MAG: hypothetical protein HN778_20425 [Prolixibacteraceae bacterium]|jgi:micrococcal nuclease|nr:hypothetical protein [Prolixibacteraceae bacterium]MBT6767277.1 hypothetical protein [Prolixibacteraceae bacterium]MBT7000131.1 hypothetical protein [Prolixibacteraceae bacterium]MBT7397203.1 hypothetical protein [Prolixibacteraceae bacterium]